MEPHYIAVIVAALAQFFVGFLWYMPLFGKLWGKIHGFDQVAPERQQEMVKEMYPMLGVQLFFTLVTSVVFGVLVANVPAEWNPFGLAGWFWLGFVVPTQVAGVIFGGTDPKWVVKKILVSVGGSLASFMVMAAIFSYLS